MKDRYKKRTEGQKRSRDRKAVNTLGNKKVGGKDKRFNSFLLALAGVHKIFKPLFPPQKNNELNF